MFDTSVLGFLGDFVINDESIVDDQIKIINYLLKYTQDFDYCDGTTITESDYNDLKKYFYEWTKFLVVNYHSKKLSCSIKKTDISEEESIFYGIKQSTIINKKTMDDEDLIMSKQYDSTAIHIWCVMINFFRVFYEYKTKSSGKELSKNVNIDGVIKKILSKWDIDIKSDYSGITDVLLYEYGLFSYNLLDTDEIDDESEDDLDREPTFDDIFYPKENLKSKDYSQPPIHEIFSSMHFFVNFMAIVHKEFFGFDEIINEPLKEGEFSVHTMLHHWFMEHGGSIPDAEMDMIERLMYCLTSFPGLREIYIYSKVFNSEDDEFLNRIKLLSYRPRRQKDSQCVYQKNVSDFIDKFNPLDDVDIPLEHFWDGNDKQTYTSESFMLFLFHRIIKNEMKYSQFFSVYTANLEGLMKEKDCLFRMSEKTPLFLKIDPYHYHLLHKKKLFNGSITALVYYWMNVNKDVGIIPHNSLDEIRHVYVWKKILPINPISPFIDLDKCLNQNPIKQNMITVNYRSISTEHKDVDIEKPVIKEDTSKIIFDVLDEIRTLKIKK